MKGGKEDRMEVEWERKGGKGSERGMKFQYN
jgi:hypothetical protein